MHIYVLVRGMCGCKSSLPVSLLYHLLMRCDSKAEHKKRGKKIIARFSRV